jgi:D-glycero-alpha-D-manno-heptose 1-phosphate guanylyltransferase
MSTRAPTPFAAVVLAGGFGTRIRHLLPDVPKPMAPVAGRPFVEHVVRYLVRGGVTQVVLSTGYLASVVEAHFAAEPVPRAAVRCVAEDEPLGTAGGFLHAVRHAGFAPECWLVLNGDSLVVADLPAFLADFVASGADAALIGLEVADAARFGSLEFASDGRLRRFVEKRPGAGTINAGVYAFRTALLESFPARRPLAFETDVFPRLIAGGAHVRVHPVAAPFLDIGTPESLAQAEAFIRGQSSALA